MLINQILFNLFKDMELNENFVVAEATRRTEREIGKILRDLLVDLLKKEEDKKQIIEEVIGGLNQGSVIRILSMLQNKDVESE